MINTTLCYIKRNNCYLMMHRDRKQNDINFGKWIGVGGKFKEGESPVECLLREVYEETGLKLKSYEFKGIVTFIYGNQITEHMFLYTSSEYNGELKDCDEGRLEWVPEKNIMNLDLWEGDRYFIPLLNDSEKVFFLKLVYDNNDNLVEVVKNDKIIIGE